MKLNEFVYIPIISIFNLVIHEFSHIFVAALYGYRCYRVEITSLGVSPILSGTNDVIFAAGIIFELATLAIRRKNIFSTMRRCYTCFSVTIYPIVSIIYNFGDVAYMSDKFRVYFMILVFVVAIYSSIYVVKDFISYINKPKVDFILLHPETF